MCEPRQTPVAELSHGGGLGQQPTIQCTRYWGDRRRSKEMGCSPSKEMGCSPSHSPACKQKQHLTSMLEEKYSLEAPQFEADFPGHGSNLHHTSDLSYCSGNAGSLTFHTTRELLLLWF